MSAHEKTDNNDAPLEPEREARDDADAAAVKEDTLVHAADLKGRPLRGLPTRRTLLASTAMLMVARVADARTWAGGDGMPWRPFAGNPPAPTKPGPWVFFSPEEGATVEALVDRLIPPDPETPGGKDCGCAVFIDRQLAGAYGSAQGLYMSPPFLPATPEQGLQSQFTPAQLYRRMLAALNAHCRSSYAGRTFAQLPDSEKDRIITGMENGSLQLQGT